VEKQCLFSLSHRHLSNCTLLGQHPSAELFSDRNDAFVAKRLSHSFPLCPKEFLIIYMYIHEFFILLYVFHTFSFFFLVIFTQLHSYTRFSSCLSHFNHKRLFIKAAWENDRVCSFEMLISVVFKIQTYKAAFGFLNSVNNVHI
jgi:hypothetical protein